jgi:hypothetical protein
LFVRLWKNMLTRTERIILNMPPDKLMLSELVPKVTMKEKTL